jgi:hypothetical protein
MNKICTGFFIIFLLGIPAGLHAGGSTEQELVSVFDFEGIDALEVREASIFDVRYEGGTSSGVHIEFIVPDNSVFRLNTRQNGSGLVLEPVQKSRPLLETGEHRILISGPRDIDLVISTSTGSVNVSRFNGAMNCVTTTGAIEAAEAEGSFSWRSSTGSQRLAGSSGTFLLNSSTGKIKLESCSGVFVLESTTGTQTGRDLLIEGDCSFTASTGSISMEFRNPMDDFTFSLSSTIGTITIGETSVSGTYAAGDGPYTITTETTTGKQVFRK